MSNSLVRTDPYSSDELQGMNDDRLEALFSLVRDAINRQYRAKDHSPAGEEEMNRVQTEACYIHRELEVRRNRKRLHEEYMKSRGHHRRGPRSGPRPNRPYRQNKH